MLRNPDPAGRLETRAIPHVAGREHLTNFTAELYGPGNGCNGAGAGRGVGATGAVMLQRWYSNPALLSRKLHDLDQQPAVSALKMLCAPTASIQWVGSVLPEPPHASMVQHWMPPRRSDDMCESFCGAFTAFSCSTARARAASTHRMQTVVSDNRCMYQIHGGVCCCGRAVPISLRLFAAPEASHRT